MAEYENDGCMDWGDAIEMDSPEYIILPEGDYIFEVVNFERDRFPGGAKIPPCNKATLTLKVKADNGIARIKTDLILHRSLEWKLSAFFRSIGQKKTGEKLIPNWQTVKGSKGRAHITVREYTDRNGNDREANDVDKYYDYDSAVMGGEPSRPSVGSLREVDDLPF